MELSIINGCLRIEQTVTVISSDGQRTVEKAWLQYTPIAARTPLADLKHIVDQLPNE